MHDWINYGKSLQWNNMQQSIRIVCCKHRQKKMSEGTQYYYCLSQERDRKYQGREGVGR